MKTSCCTHPPLPVRCRQPASMLHPTVSCCELLLTLSVFTVLRVQSSAWLKSPDDQPVRCVRCWGVRISLRGEWEVYLSAILLWRVSLAGGAPHNLQLACEYRRQQEQDSRRRQTDSPELPVERREPLGQEKPQLWSQLPEAYSQVRQNSPLLPHASPPNPEIMLEHQL